MDALSDVLKSVRLEGAVFINAEFTAPWCVRSSFGLNNAEPQLPEGSHVVFFHLLIDGECKARVVDGTETLELAGGDMVLFPHDDQHLMGSDLGLLPVDSADTVQGPMVGGQQFVSLRMGGDGAYTRCVCGFVACSRTLLRPLLDALPRMMRVSINEEPAATLVRELVRAGVSETTAERPGSASVRTKLSELLFVEAMRNYAESLPPEGRGWLAGLRDAQVGRALALMHADPERAWTVEELARAVGVSRSALGARFGSLVGKSPIQYLTSWRLALAAQDLRAGGAITRIAERSGYESEAAFSRAFKREFGAPPSAWRSGSAR